MEWKMTLKGQPRTKKNSMIRTRFGIVQSKVYRQYESDCLLQMFGMETRNELPNCINEPINVKCLYYRQDKRLCDLGNLLAATCDILVKGQVIADDNYTIVVSHDGSRVFYDKENPRVEITITSMEE